jgi:hypothetical protein
MALTTVQANNKLVQYRDEIWREYVQENMFSPYMGTSLNSIIRMLYDPKQGGEQVNIPLVKRLKNAAIASGTLVGFEEAIDNYGMRAWIDWARNAVTVKKSEQQKESAEIFGTAKPLLSDWGKELQRDEIIAALMALPSESAPAGLGSDAGQRINGVLYEAATASQNNTWAGDNSDRILYGNAVGNYSGTHATDLAKIDTTDDKFTAASVSLLKRRAVNAKPNIRPFTTDDGYAHFVCFAGTAAFRDLGTDLKTLNQDARPREGSGMSKNPLFQDGDLLYKGVIIREVPQIDDFVDTLWDSGIDGNLKTGGNGGSRVTPVFMCGQQALAMPWGQAPQPTFRKEDDYGFIKGTGIEMAYGIAKTFQKDASSNLVQWGVATGFFSSPADA